MLIKADARHLPLRDGCVDCVVTSPPYFGLRDYGGVGQIGLELSPDDYVLELRAAFTEVWRVLRDDGTCWLNLGDSYSASRGYQVPDSKHRDVGNSRPMRAETLGVPVKNLLGIPWRVAFSLQADGWYLRADIIWHKPNPMPESVTDRPTKAHEYLFLLSKSEKYYYDADAIREPAAEPSREREDRIGGANGHTVRHSIGGVMGASETRNCRSVWAVNLQPYSGAHFATMPEKLVEPCILAGCPPNGLVLDPSSAAGPSSRWRSDLDAVVLAWT